MPYRTAEDRRSAAKRRYDRDPRVKDDLVERKRKLRERNREYVNGLKERPCADCKVSYPPWVMQFDHLGEDKEDHICNLVRQPAGMARLLAEIAKCEIVCANCHAERTHNRRVVNGHASCR